MDDLPVDPHLASPRFYGRRRGRRLRAGILSALDSGLAQFGIPDLQNRAGDCHPGEFFKQRQYSSYRLEIGFGGGEHLAELAANNPEIGFIGCEVFANGVARLAQTVTGRAIPNIRVYNEDARHMLAALADDSIDQTYLLYPDPWPKKRHARRRFIHPENLNRLAKIMRNGGRLNLATDHPGYRDWVVEQFASDPRWQNICGENLWQETPWDGWLATRYEQKARAAGRKCLYAQVILIKDSKNP